MQHYTGQRARLAGLGEFVTVVGVNPHNVSVRMADGAVREFAPAWLITEPEGDTDPFDNVGTY